MAVRTRYGAGSVVMTIFSVIAGIIVAGILLVLIGANQGNTIVDVILDIGRFFTGPFNHMFPQSTLTQDVVVNWGIAAVVYLIVGAFLSRLARRA